MTLLKEHDLGTPARPGEASIHVEIDGLAVTVPEGTSVMHAAALAGIDVPKLCATDSLAAFGSCRLCLVEIDGRRGTPASCTTPVEAGMKVSTQTPRLEKLRRGVMELYISDHPLDCLTCAANGDCELQDMAGAVGLREVRYGYAGDNHLDTKKDESNPYFTFDGSKCIVCSRCVRACEETQGTFALTIAGRGFGSKVAPGTGNFLGSECVSCGACVQACPTATLEEKTVISLGVPSRTVITTCAYCGVGCSFKAEMRGDEVVRMVPYKDGGANEGHSCVKGRFAWGYATHKERVLTPMVRDAITDPWRVVSWEEAISYTADRLRSIQDRHVLAVHQRRGLRRAEDGAGRLRQQQRRHLRPRLPLPHRIRPETDLWHLGRHSGLQVDRQLRRHRRDRGEPDRGAPGLRLPDEAKDAGGCEAHRDRPASYRDRSLAARRGRLPLAAAPGDQRGGRQRHRTRRRHRRSRGSRVRGRTLRTGRLRDVGSFHLRAGVQPGGDRGDSRRAGRGPAGCAPPVRVGWQCSHLLRPRRYRAQPRSE